MFHSGHFSVCFAGERLNALPNSVEDGGANERKICGDAVSRDSGVSAKPKQKEIEDRGCDAGGHFTNKRGDSQLARAKQPANGRP